MSFTTLKARIGDAETSDRRRARRTPVELGATMRELGERGVEATVLNISESGFMAIVDAHFEIGARVWLILPGGRKRANAMVKWVAGDRIGAEFAEPVWAVHSGRRSGLALEAHREGFRVRNWRGQLLTPLLRSRSAPSRAVNTSTTVVIPSATSSTRTSRHSTRASASAVRSSSSVIALQQPAAKTVEKR